MKNIIATLTIAMIIVSNQLTACELASFSQIIILDSKQLKSEEIIETTNCPAEIQNEFSNFLSSYPAINRERTIKTKFLASIFSEIFPGQFIRFQPEVISIWEINDYLKEQKLLEAQYLLKDITAISGKKALVGHSAGFWQLNHFRAGQLGSQYFSMTTADKKQYWISANLLIATNALVVKQNIGTGKLSAEDVELLGIYTNAPQDLIIDQQSLSFYRLNRPLNAGEWLTKYDVSPLNLVENGKYVTVIMNSNHISLRASAIALQGGKYDEEIQLKTIPENKKITAKVINFNQVKIDL